ncbi:MAG: DUF1524 domain-containing protein [Myxococcales bacterium]|nr:DUF1524 domain-containing protein [Myxococcales bacterium]
MAGQVRAVHHLVQAPPDFETARNHIGGLVLLQSGPNQSLRDRPYEKKRDAYVSQAQRLLTRSLHPLAYQNNPAFSRLITETGLAFRFYDQFDPTAQAERKELYLRIAEWVWNPSRLDLDGIKAPTPEPLEVPEDQDTAPVELSVRDEVIQRFWTKLIECPKATGPPCAPLFSSDYPAWNTRLRGLVELRHSPQPNPSNAVPQSPHGA